MNSPAVCVFDLRSEAPRLRQLVRTARVAVLVFVAGCAAAVVLLAWRYTMASNWSGVHLVVIGGFAWAIVLVAGIGIFALTPPADWVEVNDEGVRFGLSGGSTFLQDWAESNVIIRLYETTGVRDSISRGKPAWAAAVGQRPFQAVLTSEAFHAILRAGTDRGLVARRVPSARKGWTRVELS
jgi:hypothetical protein